MIFTIDESIKCFNIDIIDDDIGEDVEFFELYMDSSRYNYGIHPLHRNAKVYPFLTAIAAIITIYDDDCKFIIC